jgi:hypothetical protein
MRPERASKLRQKEPPNPGKMGVIWGVKPGKKAQVAWQKTLGISAGTD